MIELGANQYGKSEVRVVRVDRDGARHEITDINVSVALSGDLADTHLTGANDKVLTTDAQKNTVHAFAREGIGPIEEFGTRLARHFVDSQPSIHQAHVSIEQYPWSRISSDGEPAAHSFTRSGSGTRRAVVHYDGERARVSAGITDLTVLNTTDSEFWGFVKDRYTTLAETKDRILATAVTAEWDYTAETAIDWNECYERARADLLAAFAGTYSLSLQQTLYAMGERVLTGIEEISEIRLSLPNKHHFLADLGPFGLDNPGEVFYASDRPYGLIEGTVRRTES
ncbi:factor-independent urate hydroxylase [Sciscionella sediminilitoris]|uniref:factor-independent urate hydroxylase n=1 Tax=Sciscionella sediminilitoris TaxID=1445613 RepID=UPI0004DFAD22|nr:urate oxidase [Sciscionella sp. SE31]